MNGAQSDELNDVSLRWKSRVFSTPVNNLIKEILSWAAKPNWIAPLISFVRKWSPHFTKFGTA